MQKSNLSAVYKRYRLNFRIAFEALISNKIRSFLSGLGIVFGVAAVICMLSIGKGTEQEILKKMEQVGVNSIIISPFSKNNANWKGASQKENAHEQDNQEEQQYHQGMTAKYSPGLSLKDAKAVEEVLPNVKYVSPYIEKTDIAVHSNRSSNVTIKAVDPDYFKMFNITAQSGSFFTSGQNNKAIPVCLLTLSSKLKLLGAKSATGKKIKIGKHWFTVCGITKSIAKKQVNSHDNDLTVYIPVNTFLSRIENRGAISATAFNAPGTNKKNQLDKIYIQLKQANELLSSSKILERLLLRKHSGIKDYQVEVPELLLKQQEETKSLFNIVLAIIAAVSLLVGGIGIMNIMNASVLERTREIGVRMATGACKKDITLQFLAEAVLICFFGGIIGVVLGIFMSILIFRTTGILTIISASSILVAFSVTTAVGVFFGFYPAKKASDKDPIESLRYE